MSWTDAPTEEQMKDAAASIGDSLYYKWLDGIDNYGKTFVGLPVEQLHGELLDSLVYLEYVARMELETYDLLHEIMDGYSALLEPSLYDRIKNYIDAVDKGMAYHLNQ